MYSQPFPTKMLTPILGKRRTMFSYHLASVIAADMFT